MSYSSDKFPPSSLNLARVSHQDQLPLSPSPFKSMSGVVPLLVNVDTSVPPPAIPTPPLSSSPSVVTFNFLQGKAARLRSPKLSLSEVNDLSSPKPMRPVRAPSGQIKYVHVIT